MTKTTESAPISPKKANLPRRIAGRLFGTVAGPCVAIAEVAVLQFDVPIQEMRNKKDAPKLETLANGLLISGVLSPIIAYHNLKTYCKEAVKAGKQGGPEAVSQSFEWLQLPTLTFFSPSASAREMRCEATKLDMNHHHSKPK